MHLRILIWAMHRSYPLPLTAREETQVFVCAVYTLYSYPSWILSSKACICCYSPLLDPDRDLANMDPCCPFREMRCPSCRTHLDTFIYILQILFIKQQTKLSVESHQLKMIFLLFWNLKVQLRSLEHCYIFLATQLSFALCIRPFVQCCGVRGVIPCE